MTHRIFFIILVLSFTKIEAQVYASQNVNLLAHLTPETDTTGSDGRKYSGCWGWHQASKNKEYAIVGTSSKTYFIDVTTPTSPVIVDSVMARRTGCTWREIKNYQNYCYIVSDDAPPNSFQIVDMQYLPDSVHVVYDDTTYFETCHTIFVDKDNLYCGYPRSNTGPPDNMRVYSIATPTAPVLQRKLNQDAPAGMWLVHDMYVRNDTVYASCGGFGLNIYKFNGTAPFTILANYSGYINAGYNHSSWQTDNRKTMVFADEVPAGLTLKVIDVQDINNIQMVKTISSHVGATAHNPYIVGNNWCWVSTYQDGIYLYDISNPANTSIHGYFDTHPQHGFNDNYSTDPYRGNWGAYPYLPSNIIIACDMQNGIFILEGDATYKSSVGVKENMSNPNGFTVYPNPASNELNMILKNQLNTMVDISIVDVLGQVIESKTVFVTSDSFKYTIASQQFANGYYFIHLKNKNINQTQKISIQH